MRFRKPASESHRWRARVGLAVVALLALSGLGSERARAQELRAIDLGEGRSVRQVPVPCGYGRCLRWQPQGLRFTGHSQRLAYARAFAWVPSTGRIVASYYANTTPTRYPGQLFVDGDDIGNAGLLFTDDGGRSWERSDWPWPNAANAIAFDRERPFGVAVGDAGHVWSTDDGGRTWRDRRSDSGVVYTQVAVLGRATVFADDEGQVWRSTDGGFRRRSLVESAGVELSTQGDAIVVESGGGEVLVRVNADGSIVRP